MLDELGQVTSFKDTEFARKQSSGGMLMKFTIDLYEQVIPDSLTSEVTPTVITNVNQLIEFLNGSVITSDLKNRYFSTSGYIAARASSSEEGVQGTDYLAIGGTINL